MKIDSMDKVKKIREEVVKLKSQLLRGACSSQTAMETRCKEDVYDEVLSFIDSMQEEPVSEDLEEAAEEYSNHDYNYFDVLVTEYDGTEHLMDDKRFIKDAFIEGVKWQKEHLWKSAEGPDLPIIDREVIALLDNGKVVFAHRPPEYWDGKDIVTGKVTRNYPKTYDKGGWNIPDVKWWLDCLLPNIKED